MRIRASDSLLNGTNCTSHLIRIASSCYNRCNSCVGLHELQVASRRQGMSCWTSSCRIDSCAVADACLLCSTDAIYIEVVERDVN